MNDSNTALCTLKDEVLALCRRKGWGENGVQNPQHVAMAMLVETLELLEHFTGNNMCPSDSEIVDIGEELADVMMYSLQLMYVLRYDVSRGLGDEFSDEITAIATLKDVVRREIDLRAVAMRVAVDARFVLEFFQWMTPCEVRDLTDGGMPEKREEIGRAFVCEFRRLLTLAVMLDIDIAEAIMRKIAIVDKRIYGSDEPAR